MNGDPKDRNSGAYKLKYSEAGKGFFGGGKKWSPQGYKNAREIFGESPNLRKKDK